MTATIVDVLRGRADRDRARTAFTFLPDGQGPGISISYGELDARARAIAVALRERTAAGDRVLVLCPPGLDYIAAFLGCQYAGVIAVPAYPPSNRRTRPADQRLQVIAADAQVALTLTTTEHAEDIEKMFAAGATASDTLAVDAVPAALAELWRETTIDRGAIAFLQYTSGSTSQPRGVMVTHDNLLHNQRAIAEACAHAEDSTFVSWLPLYHDMGLVGTIVQPLYIGATGVFMPPAAFLQNPLRWLTAITRFHGRTSGGPNFAYELCVRRIGEEQRGELDLSSWSVAFNGAEPVRAATLDRFAAAFAPCGFRREAFFPCYGLAEATLIVSGHRLRPTPYIDAAPTAAANVSARPHDATAAEPPAAVGCGGAVVDTTIAIVDAQTGAICPSGSIGEIWVSSPSVAAGYWNRPDTSAQTFRARAGDDPRTFLRTGDLGFMRDDHLFVTGRSQDLIIIRGQNHHPEDLEWTVQQALPAVLPNAVAAFSVDVAGEERLALVLERLPKGTPDGETLAEDARRALAEQHGLQTYGVLVVGPGAIPKTSSGKIQRHLCRRQFEAGQFEATTRSILDASPDSIEAPIDAEVAEMMAAGRKRTKLESHLAAQIGALLKIGVAPVDRPLTALGIDSMTALELKHRLEQDFGVSIALSALLGDATVATLTDRIVAHSRGTAPAAPRRERREETESPLSYGQQSLRFLHERAPASTAYTIARAVWIRGAVDVGALDRALAAVIDRHATLRSIFTIRHGVAMQCPTARSPQAIVRRDASGWSERDLREQLTDEAHRPFDLEHGPVLRATIFTVSPDRHALLLAVHHLAADLWSFGVILQDLGRAYEAARAGRSVTSDEPPATYADYVRWQSEMLAGARGSELQAFWRDAVSGDLPVVDLPTDAPRPATLDDKGARDRFRVPPALAARVRELARSRGATPFVVLLAAFEALLHRLTGRPDLVLGTLAPGRTRPEFSEVVGYFTNPIALRSSLAAGTTFVELLDRAQHTLLAAFDHQDYPFPLLLSQLHTARDESRLPLVQMLFAMQKAPSRYQDVLSTFAVGAAGATATVGGLELELMPLAAGAAQFDVSVFVAESGDGIDGVIEYRTSLFAADRMRRFADSYLQLLEALVGRPDRPVDSAAIVSHEEWRALEAWNATDVAMPDACVHHLFELQASRTPDATAMVCGRDHVTYAALNRRVNQTVRHLQRFGVKTDKPIGICLHRGAKLVEAIWAVLKAGTAYVPLNPDDPTDRLYQMLDDANAALVIVDERTVAPFAKWSGRTIELEASSLIGQSGEDLNVPIDPRNLAYIIHTSGSTGRPKGAMNTHESLLNRIEWMQRAYTLTTDDRVLQKTPATFDVSVWEFTWPLMHGACLVVAAPGGHRDVEYLTRTIIDEQITTIHFVPSMLELFAAHDGAANCRSLRRVIASGEALTTTLAARCASRLDALLHNLYGPTECAIDVSSWTYDAGHRTESATVPIGGPIANTRLYVVNAAGQLVPRGTEGELWIGGVAVGRGYVRKPTLTAARFVPDPFSPSHGARCYRTGDLVRARPDGALEFVGRIDRQIKLRGQRIELAEIEAVLLEQPQVRHAAVVLREDQPGNQRLLAYVVLADAEASLTPIWTALARRLPDALMPAAIKALDALPVTAHGKLNAAALPAVDVSRPLQAGVFIAPRNSLEGVIAKHWATALSVDHVGIHDNFFEAGGHSLVATQLVWQLQELFPTEVPLLNLFFQNPTVAAFADAIVRESPPDADPHRVADNYRFVELLSDSDAEQMLETVTR